MNGIIHRDIKPENIVLDAEGQKLHYHACSKDVFFATGYARITDLGIARIWRPDNSSDTSGTPGYMGMI